jgi:hypothetical protein
MLVVKVMYQRQRELHFTTCVCLLLLPVILMTAGARKNMAQLSGQISAKRNLVEKNMQVQMSFSILLNYFMNKLG